MTDYFALLDEPRRPWLDESEIKARFQTKSIEFHPDRFHSASIEDRKLATVEFEKLNAASQCLINLKQRLQHLLELETGVKPEVVEKVDEDIMGLFLKVGQVIHQVDKFLRERDTIDSPLLKVGKFQEGMEWGENLKTLLAEIRSTQEAAYPELMQMNAHWLPPDSSQSTVTTRSLPLARLECLYRRVSHTSRWIAQLQDRIMRLQIG